jgi:hypothetical protein
MKSSAYSEYLNIIAKLATRCVANAADPRWYRRPAMQAIAHPSLSRHGLSHRDGPMKSTKFYYPAKIFRLLSTTVMTMIRILVLSPDRRDVRIARMQAPR